MTAQGPKKFPPIKNPNDGGTGKFVAGNKHIGYMQPIGKTGQNISLGVGGFAEFQSAFVLFVLSHQQVLHPGGFADDEHQEAGGDGVEGAAVADFPLVEAATNKVNNVVGSAAGGLIHQK